MARAAPIVAASGISSTPAASGRQHHPLSRRLASPAADELRRHAADRDQAAGDGVHDDRRTGGQLATELAEKLP